MTPNGSVADDLTDAEVAVAAAATGVQVVRDAYGTRQSRIMKSVTDFATEADVASERAILDILAQHRPVDAFEGEESGLSGVVDSDRRWLIDPLCGTANFAATTPLASVNVALTQRDEVLAAVSADPIADEVFWTDDNGAFVRNADGEVELMPTTVSRLVDVNCDGPVDVPFVGAQLIADAAFRAAWGPRVVSTSLAVAWVAAGRRAAYITDGSLAGSVHFTAGIALCRAAGCVVSDLAGDALHSGRGDRGS